LGSSFSGGTLILLAPISTRILLYWAVSFSWFSQFFDFFLTEHRCCTRAPQPCPIVQCVKKAGRVFTIRYKKSRGLNFPRPEKTAQIFCCCCRRKEVPNTYFIIFNLFHITGYFIVLICHGGFSI